MVGGFVFGGLRLRQPGRGVRLNPTPPITGSSVSGSAASFAGPYQPILDLFADSSARGPLAARQKRLNRSVDELGLQFGDASHKAGLPRWGVDLFPLVLKPEVWHRIAAGVVQRAKAFNAYATDLYASQNVLRDRILPYDVALRDPAFLRPFSGIEVPNGEYSQFGAFDLVEVAPDDWRVVEHHMGTPFGLAHVLQNRRMLSEVFPEIYERIDAAPVEGFSTYLLEMLRAQTSKRNPHILLLTAGLPGQAYFEEALIARRMGFSVARPGDLLVRDSKVYLRTIRGLELIDVIFRRLESASLDSIAVPGGFGLGVPGLTNVWRKGNVSIVNAPGAGVADNRALLRYDARLIRYYLKERVVLPSVETYHLSDPDQAAFVAEHDTHLQIKPVQDHDIVWRQCGGERPRTASVLARLAAKHPQYFVAQSIPESVRMPKAWEGGMGAQEIFLRVYYILGKEPIVLPGGLARGRSADTRTKRLTLVTSGLRDVIVPDEVVTVSKPKRAPVPAGERFSISSRVAESLYWAGRYLERAENTARQLETLERLRWDQMARSEQHTYWPLLQAVAAATGQSQYVKSKRPLSDTFPLSRSLVLDRKKGASVFACIDYGRNALESVREIISPECRSALEEIILYMNQVGSERISRSGLRDICANIVSEVARFNGTVERTMPHDDAWQFYRMGSFFERGIEILLLLEVALPRIMESFRAEDEESADLTALLRLLGSLDAYRREYRSRAYLDRVVTLIFTSSTNPSSLSFCLRNLHYAIKTLSIASGQELGEAVLGEIDDLISSLGSVSVIRWHVTDRQAEGEEVALPKPDEFGRELEAWTTRLEALHERIEDRYFTHQHEFAREPLLFDFE